MTPVRDPRPKRCHYPIPISHQRFVLCVGGGEGCAAEELCGTECRSAEDIDTKSRIMVPKA